MSTEQWAQDSLEVCNVVDLSSLYGRQTASSNEIEWHARQAVCACVCVCVCMFISNGLDRFGSSCCTCVLAGD